MLSVSKSSKIHCDAELITGVDGRIIIGKNCHIKKGVVFNCYSGNIILSNNVTIGEYSVLYGHGNITIDANVAIAPQCVISAQKHIFPANVPLRYSGEIINPIVIKEDCIISAQVVITEGVTIGHHSIIGAGSIVTGSIPNFSVAFGNPCKVVHTNNEHDLYGYDTE